MQRRRWLAGHRVGTARRRGRRRNPDDDPRRPLARGRDNADAVLARLNRLIGRHVPQFAASTRIAAWRRRCAGLAQAIDTCSMGSASVLAPTTQRGEPLVTRR